MFWYFVQVKNFSVINSQSRNPPTNTEVLNVSNGLMYRSRNNYRLLIPSVLEQKYLSGDHRPFGT